MEALVGLGYMLAGGFLVVFGALLGGGIVKSMIPKKEEEK